jgi:hypothetical protein
MDLPNPKWSPEEPTSAFEKDVTNCFYTIAVNSWPFS